MEHKYIFKSIVFSTLLILFLLSCSYIDKVFDKKDNLLVNYKITNTENTPTGFIVHVTIDEKDTINIQEVAKIIVDEQCDNHSYPSIRIVLSTITKENYGILGKLCNENKYYGQLSNGLN